ncbi:MAG: hypothetical protein QF812_03610 [Nitrososphaerales archaeon]|nr:hypothetical protein [Nitrososphaerales archaeon]HJN57671.1 hypothetical protein [Nitrososphaerales archaeon]
MHIKLLKPTKIKAAVSTAFADIDLQKAETTENISFILYLVPLISSTIYAISLWTSEGLSSTLPETVYLSVTKDPYLFLISFLAICCAVLIEVFGSSKESRLSRIETNSKQIQILAVISFSAAVLSVWSTIGYSFDISRTLQILLAGRYALIFPLMLFILAFLLNTSLKFNLLSFNNLMKNASFILMIASPLIFYGLWRIHVPWEGIISITLIILIIGVALILYKGLDQTS